MNPQRRVWLALLASGAAGAARAQSAGPADDPVRRGRVLRFPRDHGAHLGARTEWWYVTGWQGSPERPTQGFQVTFFRSRTGLAERVDSRFAARHLLFAHAAITRLPGAAGAAATHRHDGRIARWNGLPGAAGAQAARDDADVSIGNWWLRREGDTWRTRLPARDFTLELAFERTQPILLQGDAGFSRKGPQEAQASHYYSEPQLRLAGAEGGRAWLDHEWSEEILHPEAVGWDWIGMNLFDGSALTAFVLRRRDGSSLWAGGSLRAAGGAARAFQPDDLRWAAGRRWKSPASGAVYPVEWALDSPAGSHRVRALLDAQELDSRGSTGTVYWEGLSELLDTQGRRVGLGYLEMTGYVEPLRLR